MAKLQYQARYSIDELKKMVPGAKEKGTKKIALAYPSFVRSFRNVFPKMEIISHPSEVRNFDMIIFSGGEDINPKYYHEQNICSYGVNERRDEIERAVFSEAYDKNKKVLGVCRGHQLIGALLGGSLYQDFASSIDEDGDKIQPHGSRHELNWVTDGVLYRFFRNEMVSSLHHQAIRSMGYAMRYVCTYQNVIEGCESENIVTTQFHPEFDYIPGNAAAKFFEFLATEW